MAWVASEGDDYGSAAESAGFVGAWDMTAEQLPMHLLAAGHPDVPEPLAQALWRGFDKPVGSYGGHRCVYEPAGTLFTAHLPLVSHPFQRVRDLDGRDWWANAREVTLADRAWCEDQADRFRTFTAGLWGLTDGVDLEGDRPWYAPARFDLNKGALLGAAALGSTPVWDAFSEHPRIARGAEVLGFTAA